jgi:hypothetical protein
MANDDIEATLDKLATDSIKNAYDLIREYKETPTPAQDTTYNAAGTRALMKEIFRDALKNGEVAKPRTVRFLAGAYGAKNLLLAASEQPQTQETKDIAEASKHAAFLDYTKVKGVLNDFAKPTLKEGETLTEAEERNYDKLLRRLVSGMDTALADYTRTKSINLVADKSLALNGGSEKSMTDRLEADRKDGSKVIVYAVALTPEQSIAEAAKLGIPADQAETSARDFAAGFEKLKAQADTLILLDKDMHPMYIQRDGQPVTITSATDPDASLKAALALEAWKKASGAGTSTMAPLPGKKQDPGKPPPGR